MIDWLWTGLAGLAIGLVWAAVIGACVASVIDAWGRNN